MTLTTAVFGSEAVAQERRITPAESATVTGCVMKEEDYRRTARLPNLSPGRGNEYILANATAPPSASAGTTPPADTSAGTATGTAGRAGTASAAPKVAFELTGNNEKQVEPYVGKRVEIVGTLKAAEVGLPGPTGEPGAAAPDLKLRELEVTSVMEIPGACTP
jgi:hypothetical protein